MIKWTEKPLSEAHNCYDKMDRKSLSDGGIVVSIAAFQAVDPGSIPGHRIRFVLRSKHGNSDPRAE